VDDLLAKVDRASMAVSLEVRVPILDQRIVGICSPLFLSNELSRWERKWLLAKGPGEVCSKSFDRAPSRFLHTYGDWLRGRLKWWVEDLLDERN